MDKSLLHRERTEAGSLDFLANADGPILMPAQTPVLLGRFVEQIGSNRLAVLRENMVENRS